MQARGWVSQVIGLMIHFKCCLNSNAEPKVVVVQAVVALAADATPCCTLINYKLALSRLPPSAGHSSALRQCII